MDYKAQIKKWRIIALCTIGIGFIGFLIGCILWAVSDDAPSIEAIVVAASFGGLMLSSLFFLIPFRKAANNLNNQIFAEYGSTESKKKTYDLYYTGCIIYGKYDINVVIASPFLLRRRSPVFGKLILSPSCFSAGKITSFQWEEVKRIEVFTSQDHIKISLNTNNIPIVYLPYKKNIIYLIKTFCSVEIENYNEALT